MIQTQLLKLIHTFNQRLNNHYDLERLLNDSDYRNQALDQSQQQLSLTQLTLVMRIRAFEDQLHHELKVDLVAEQRRSA